MLNPLLERNLMKNNGVQQMQEQLQQADQANEGNAKRSFKKLKQQLQNLTKKKWLLKKPKWRMIKNSVGIKLKRMIRRFNEEEN